MQALCCCIREIRSVVTGRLSKLQALESWPELSRSWTWYPLVLRKWSLSCYGVSEIKRKNGWSLGRLCWDRGVANQRGNCYELTADLQITQSKIFQHTEPLICLWSLSSSWRGHVNKSLSLYSNSTIQTVQSCSRDVVYFAHLLIKDKVAISLQSDMMLQSHWL